MGIEINSNGVNAKIKANILSNGQMKSIGFTNHHKPDWYYNRIVPMPSKYKKSHIEISFNVTIPKDGSEIKIDILDEDFLQPYDYQYMIENSTTNDIPYIVRDFVESQMEFLQSKGVLTGHIKGEYI